MRRLTIAYLILSAWLSGWLLATFGLGLALFGTAIFVLPAYVAWRITSNDRPAKRREYGYLAGLTCLAVIATVFLVQEWHGRGRDSVAIFNRECRELRGFIANNPEYKDVEIEWGSRKGNGVILHGSVHSVRLHDELISAAKRTIRYGWYYDRVEYPGKPSKDNLSSADR